MAEEAAKAKNLATEQSEARKEQGLGAAAEMTVEECRLLASMLLTATDPAEVKRIFDRFDAVSRDPVAAEKLIGEIVAANVAAQTTLGRGEATQAEAARQPEPPKPEARVAETAAPPVAAEPTVTVSSEHAAAASAQGAVEHGLSPEVQQLVEKGSARVGKAR